MAKLNFSSLSWGSTELEAVLLSEGKSNISSMRFTGAHMYSWWVLLSLLSIKIWLHTSPTMLISIAYHPALHFILATLKNHAQSCKVAFSWGFCCLCELLLFSDLVMASQRPPVLFMVTCSITSQFACNPTLTFGVTSRTVAWKHA